MPRVSRLPAALVGLVLSAVLAGPSPGMLCTGAFAGYALWVTFDRGLRPARGRARRGEAPPQAAWRSFRRAPRLVGAYVAHLGIIVTFIAVAVSSSFQVEDEGTLQVGESLAVGGYEIKLAATRVEQRPHFVAQVASLELERNGRSAGTLEPSLNHYPTEMQPLGTPAVRTRASHDLYLTLMDIAPDGSIGLRAIVTPGVVWIWLGIVIVVLGTGLCLLPATAIAATRAPDEVPMEAAKATP